MKIVFSALAKNDLDEIFETTIEKWGMQQAENYLMELHGTINLTAKKQKVWRRMLDADIQDISLDKIFFVSYKRHFVFFTELKKSEGIRILRVLHERMNIPSQIKNSILV